MKGIETLANREAACRLAKNALRHAAGLSLTEYILLSAACRGDDSTPLFAARSAYGIKPARASRALRNLESEGLLTTHAPQADLRRIALHGTDQGQRILDACTGCLEAVALPDPFDNVPAHDAACRQAECEGGLSFTQMRMLLELSEHEAGSTERELCQRLALKQNTANVALRALERRSLVLRNSHDTAHHLAKRITVTEEGAEAARVELARYEAAFESITVSIGKLSSHYPDSPLARRTT